MIAGVNIQPLEIFKDERGAVMRMLRSDNPLYKKFGEIYFSLINPGIIKGWKKHARITQHFAVPIGNIKLVLYDDQENSSTKGEIQEIILGVDNYQLIKIPPNIWYSWQVLDNTAALIANLIDLPHDSTESITKDLYDNNIPYKWK